MKHILLFIIILVAAISCNSYNHQKDRKKETRNSNLITIVALKENIFGTADCIYCDNTRAMNGNCTCYPSMSVAACSGRNAGQGKSNSYKISCGDLTSIGVWAELNDHTFYCQYTGCPPEAYRAAFTADGR